MVEEAAIKDAQARSRELEFVATLYGDPLRPATEKSARNLALLSLLLLAVVKFGAQVQSTSLFPITFAQTDVLPTVMSVLVGLLLLTFAARIAMDLGLFLEGEKRISQYIWESKVAAAIKAAKEIDDQLYAEPQGEDDSDPDPWWVDAFQIQDAAREAEDKIQTRLGRKGFARLIRFARVVGEVSLPLALAGASLWMAAPRWQWPK